MDNETLTLAKNNIKKIALDNDSQLGEELYAEPISDESGITIIIIDGNNEVNATPNINHLAIGRDDLVELNEDETAFHFLLIDNDENSYTTDDIKINYANDVYIGDDPTSLQTPPKIWINPNGNPYDLIDENCLSDEEISDSKIWSSQKIQEELDSKMGLDSYKILEENDEYRYKARVLNDTITYCWELDNHYGEIIYNFDDDEPIDWEEKFNNSYILPYCYSDFENNRCAMIYSYSGKEKVVCPQAFYNYETIEEAILPDCEYIGERAFHFDYNLSKVYAPMCKYVTDGAFYMCESLSNINFDNCIYIGASAFFSCNLSSVNFPNCLYVGDEAFKWSPINDINLPNCKYIGYSAFFNARESTLNLPNCKYLDAGAFEGNLNLTDVNLPNCEGVGWICFYDCIWLSNFSAPKCSFIGDGAFKNCSSLSCFDFKNVELIADEAFNKCTNLRYVADAPKLISDNLKSLAFNGCTNLRYVNIENLEVCHYGLFNSCKNLTYVSLPLVSYLSTDVFRFCSNLSTIKFKNLEFIGSRVFAECCNFKNLIIQTSKVATLFSSNAFTHNIYGIRIKVPQSLVTAYQSATNWSYFSSIIVAMSEADYDAYDEAFPQPYSDEFYEIINAEIEEGEVE